MTTASRRWFLMGVLDPPVDDQPLSGWEELDRYLLSRNVAVNVPPQEWQTTGGVHSPTSFHYQGLARDYSAGMGCDENGIVRELRAFATPGGVITELYHAPTGTWLKNGEYMNVGGHRDHVHVAIRDGRSLPAPGPLPQSGPTSLQRTEGGG